MRSPLDPLQAPVAPSPALAEAAVERYPSRALAKGEPVYRYGDPASAAYRVEEGLVKLVLVVPSGRERIVALAGPGDWVGALTPDQRVHPETASALSPRVRVRAVPGRALRDGEGEALRAELAEAAGAQLAALRASLEDGELPVPARLARTLLRLGQRFGQQGENGVVRLTLPLTHDNLAAMVGAARETTTAVLGQMRRDGLLLGTRGRYAFPRDALREFAAESALG